MIVAVPFLFLFPFFTHRYLYLDVDAVRIVAARPLVLVRAAGGTPTIPYVIPATSSVIRYRYPYSYSSEDIYPDWNPEYMDFISTLAERVLAQDWTCFLP
jgi:hypothetical protein